MLTELRVRDLAVIQDVTLPLGPGLNVLTGETGAGKSMLVDALSLLLGERASSDIIRPGAERAVVEAAFELDAVADLDSLADRAGIDVDDGRLVVRRYINAEGRNRAWANGSPSTVGALAAAGRDLVDLHGQHEAQSLLRGSAQRDILDAFGDLLDVRRSAADAFARCSTLKARESELIEKRDEVTRKADYLRHVVKEIADAKLRPAEDEELEVEAKRLSNVEDLTRSAEGLLEVLDGEEHTTLANLAHAARAVSQLERIDESVGTWRELLDAAEANVAELVDAVREYAAGIEADPRRLAQVEQRRDLIYRLKQKYGPDLPDVVRTGEESARELDLLDTADLDLANIVEERERAEAEFTEIAQRLTRGRKKTAASLDKAVGSLLPGLGLKKGRFAVSINPARAPSAAGNDSIEFLVTLNVGMEPRPLSQVASGGELSRLMLALKVVLAQHDKIPTLVFDEVDQGIGGEVAVQVADALSRVSNTRQVLIITHLPQIAARADRHIRVDKPVRDGMPSTDVQALNDSDRVVELARMLGDGNDPVALEHAREMLKRGSGTTGAAGRRIGQSDASSAKRDKGRASVG
jgi:DNA repair protein RecN (Recombination protein N)